MKSSIKKRMYAVYIALFCTIGLLNGCDMLSEVDTFFGKRNAYVAPPAPEVTVATPEKSDVIDYATFTGTTKAIETVNLAARVTGSLQKTGYTEGDVVKKGTLLFTIEPAMYEAKVAAAKANVAAQQAVLSQAKTEYARASRLYRANAGSDTDLVKWREARDSAQASVDMAKAELMQAEINLGYTQIRAPFDGRVGLWKVDTGNLVGPESGNTELGTMIRYTPMYAYFTVSGRDIERLASLRKERGVTAYKAFPVEMNAGGHDGFNRKGELDYGDLGIDASSGTYLLRGVFPNDDGFLLPGMFVRVRFVAEELKDALVIPASAVSEDQAGKYVLVVGEKNLVARRAVVLGPSAGQGKVVVREGLMGDERVIVAGLMRARAGMPVSTK